MENGYNVKGISAILFDLDNTLIPTRKADKQACAKLPQILWERWAVPLEIGTAACKIYLRTFRKCPENISMSLDTWRRLLWAQALGEQYNKFAGEVFKVWLQLRYDFLALTPEIVNLLQILRQHYFVGLITNGTSRAQWEKIEKLHLQQFFDVMLVSGDLPWEKPKREIFQMACDYLGVKPQQCIMVGDKLDTDILGGVKANLGGTVWVPLNSMETDSEEDYPKPDYTIGHVTDLQKLLPKPARFLSVRRQSFKANRFFSLPDFEDGNSNSSDGS